MSEQLRGASGATEPAAALAAVASGRGESRLIAGPAGRFWILTASVVLIFMTGMEGTVVATAMPTIISQLGGFELFSWVFSGYFLAQGVTIPIYGRLADLYGRKRVLFFGLIVFVIGTTFCGLAPNMLWLVVFRVVQGIGAGAVQPINQTLIGDLYPPAQRAKMAGFFSGIWGIAAIVGPVLGAFVIAAAAWNWVFWITVPIAIIGFVLLAFALHERIEHRAHRIDYLGAFLMALGIGLILYALIQAHHLGLSAFLLLLVVAAAVMTWLIIHERRVPEPILPLTVWRNRVILSGVVGCFGVGCVVMASTTFLPAYIQGVMGRSPIVAGYALAISSVTWIGGSWAGGQIMLRASYRAATNVGGIFLVIGISMLIALDPSPRPALGGDRYRAGRHRHGPQSEHLHRRGAKRRRLEPARHRHGDHLADAHAGPDRRHRDLWRGGQSDPGRHARRQRRRSHHGPESARQALGERGRAGHGRRRRCGPECLLGRRCVGAHDHRRRRGAAKGAEPDQRAVEPHQTIGKRSPRKRTTGARPLFAGAPFGGSFFAFETKGRTPEELSPYRVMTDDGRRKPNAW